MQIGYSAMFCYDAHHLNILDSQSGWGSIMSLINELKEGNAESEYLEAAANYVSASDICLIVTICSACYLIYKIFDDKQCSPKLMHLLIGIGLAACMVSTYMSGVFFTSAMKYALLTTDDKTPLYGMAIILVFLLWAWYYFHISLKDVLSVSSSEGPKSPVKKTEGINSDKTQKLIQLKGLLDSGILTQEEFDQHKKEILNS